MERYLMYLRKSRMDTDYENVSVAETLSRHRTILENLCKAKKLHVVEVLEEVVSGESLYTRPRRCCLYGYRTSIPRFLRGIRPYYAGPAAEQL